MSKLSEDLDRLDSAMSRQAAGRKLDARLRLEALGRAISALAEAQAAMEGAISKISDLAKRPSADAAFMESVLGEYQAALELEKEARSLLKRASHYTVHHRHDYE